MLPGARQEVKQVGHLSSAFGAAHGPPAALASLGEEIPMDGRCGRPWEPFSWELNGPRDAIMGTKLLSLWYQHPSANGIPLVTAVSLRCDHPQGTTEDAHTPGMLLPEGCCL